MADAATQWEAESSVLKPVDKKMDSDDWPTFALNDAVVCKPDGTTLGNVLLVDTDGPFVVRGWVDVDDEEDEQYLVDPNRKKAPLQIVNSTKYSLGLDALPVIWVSGESGWFEIHPAPAYVDVYRDMCDVAAIYHHLVDLYQAAAEQASNSGSVVTRALRQLDVREVLFEIAFATGDSTTYDELADKCVRLGPHLLAHMARTHHEEVVVWKDTSFYLWLVRQRKEYDRSQRRAMRETSASQSLGSTRGSQGSPTPGPGPGPVPGPVSGVVPVPVPVPGPPSSLSTELPLRPPETVNTALPTATRTATPSSTLLTSTDPSRPMPPEAQPLFDAFLRAVRDIAAELGDPSKIHQSKIHGRLSLLYRLRKYSVGQNLSSYFATPLLAALGPAWHGSGYFVTLNEFARHPFTPKEGPFVLAEAAQQLRRRAPQGHDRLPRRVPSSSSLSEAAAAAAAAAAADATTSTAHRLRHAGKQPMLRLPGAQKRVHESAFSSSSEPADDNNDLGRPRKSARVLAEDEEMQEVGNEEDSEDEDDESDDTEDSGNTDDDNPDLVLTAESRALAADAVHGRIDPNRTWHCPVEGCPFFVRNAVRRSEYSGNKDEDEDEDDDEDDDDGDDQDVQIAREMVRLHQRSHARDVTNRVNLALTEGRRGNINVSHLLDKIRKAQETESPGPRQPIARRFRF